ncbi:MAG: hypothetical protein EOO13_16875, partial [Chitinophagaceae bacterium]
FKGLEAFSFELPAFFNEKTLLTETLKLVQKNQENHARVRLTIIRGRGGLYDPSNHNPNFIIQSWPLETEFGGYNSNGLQLCLYDAALKSCDTFSNLKHNNFLPYTAGALFAKQHRCNDALVFNHYKNLCESTIANLFIIKEGSVYTPPLSEGCIAGVIRRIVINELPSKGFIIKETPLNVDMLLQAEEVFLTNSMYPMRWVQSVEGKVFRNNISLQIYKKLQQTFPEIFC